MRRTPRRGPSATDVAIAAAMFAPYALGILLSLAVHGR